MEVMNDFNTMWLICFGLVITWLCVVTINFEEPEDNDE